MQHFAATHADPLTLPCGADGSQASMLAPADIPKLRQGDYQTRDEMERRYEAMPHHKKAGLFRSEGFPRPWLDVLQPRIVSPLQAEFLPGLQATGHRRPLQ